MAKKCNYCGKGVTVGMKISHSHIRTKRTWEPNLQNVRAVINGRVKKVKACTRCLKGGRVERAL